MWSRGSRRELGVVLQHWWAKRRQQDSDVIAVKADGRLECAETCGRPVNVTMATEAESEYDFPRSNRPVAFPLAGDEETPRRPLRHYRSVEAEGQEGGGDLYTAVDKAPTAASNGQNGSNGNGQYHHGWVRAEESGRGWRSEDARRRGTIVGSFCAGMLLYTVWY